jgi:iron complex outermembrane receptor protein
MGYLIMSPHRKKILWIIPAALSAGVVAPVSTYAQDGANAIESVTVTARRREENVQDVPVSVAALSGEQMELRGIERIENVVASTPNVLVSSGPSGAVDASFSMRGIPRAGFFVDGIWQQSNLGLSTRSTTELQSVEVLRGPQGTLYGRDSTGGAIRLQTKLPAEEFGARMTATLGSYDRRDVGLNMDLPITDTLFSKISIASEQRDGYVESITIDKAFGDMESLSLRGDLLWKPNDRFTARLTIDHQEQEGTQANYTLLMLDPGTPGPSPGFGFQVPPYQYYELVGVQFNCQGQVPECPGGRVGDLQTTSDFDAGPGIDIDIDSVTARFDFEINDALTISSLTNYTEQDSWFYAHFDNSDVDFFSQGTYAEREGWSQEFQLAGDVGKFHYVGGLYTWRTDNISRFMRWTFWDFRSGDLDFSQVSSSPQCTSWIPTSGLTPCIMVPGSSESLISTREEGYAGFGELSYDITDTLSLTVGGRYHDQKNTTWTELFSPNTAPRSNIPGQLPSGDLVASAGRVNPYEYTFDKVTYRAALTNKFTDDLMAYVGMAQGYNGGGISRVNIPQLNGGLVLTDFPYDPETINNYELGLRSTWLGGSLQVNVTGFFTEWEDIQLSGTVRNPVTGEVLPTFVIQNAATAEAKGVEVSVIYLPTRSLQFNVDVGTLDTKYTSLSSAASEISLDSKFGQAPELQYNLGAQWKGDLGRHGLVARADYSYTSGFMRSYVPGDQSTTYTGKKWEQEAYGLLNTRLVFMHESGKWEAAVFGTNLTDERYTTGGFFSPLLLVDDGTIGRPREYGVSVKVNFQ